MLLQTALKVIDSASSSSSGSWRRDVLGEDVSRGVCGVTGGGVVVRLWSFTLSHDEWRHGHVHLKWGCMKERITIIVTECLQEVLC